MVIKEIAHISDDLRSFILKGNYEPYLLRMMNDSKIVFPGKYNRNEEQSAGQCDFFDVDTFEKFEAKLPFDKKEGKLIGTEPDFVKWIRFMMDEAEEFGEKIVVHRGEYKIEELYLYKTLKKRLATVKQDENPIFFFPYPIVLDMEPIENVFPIYQMCSDYLSYIFTALKSNDFVGNRKIYAIYPTSDSKIVLRCLNNNVREYLFYDELKDVFHYQYILLDDE